MNIRIDYFTGTGGSRRVAEQITDNLKACGSEVSLNRIVRDKFVPLDEGLLCFGFRRSLFFRTQARV